MLIEKNKIVSFHYKVSENSAELENSHNEEPMCFLVGREGLISGLEQAMQGKIAGDSFSVTLPPEQAYGFRSQDAVQRLPRKNLGTKKKLKPGDIVTVNTSQGPVDVAVIKAGKFMVDVDGNHPLAGKTLTFNIDIVAVRDATEEELAHGHAHGAGGHKH